MSGPKQKAIAFPAGGWTVGLPIEKIKMEAAYGQALSNEFIDALEKAFQQYGRLCDQLRGPRNNKNRNDLRSLPIAKSKIEKSLRKSVSEIENVIGLGDFFQLICVGAMNSDEGPEVGSELHRLVLEAQRSLLRASAIVKNSRHLPDVLADESDAKKWLVRRVLEILAYYKLDADLSGWKESTITDLPDLTRAERLIYVLAIHDSGDSELSSFARWVRRASEKPLHLLCP